VTVSDSGVERFRLFIDGQWCDAENGARFATMNPYTGEEWGSVAEASAADVDRAVSQAHAAFLDWRHTLGKDRAKLLHRIADLVEANAAALAATETRDNGKIIREMLGQVTSLPDYYRYWAGWADKVHGSVAALDKPEIFHYTVREPLGVIGAITPWNSPLLLLTWKLAPALATGNTMVVKPSEHASASTVEFARLVERAGLPAGVFNVVTGGPDTAQALVRHPKLAKVAFTGGGATARLVAKSAAENLVPLSLELGGKSPNIVFNDADLNAALKGVTAGIFGASGQTCIAGSRLLVQADIADDFLAALVEKTSRIRLGDPSDPDTEMGPVCFPEHLERIRGVVDDAVVAGARLMTGGRIPKPSDAIGNGYFYEPTIVSELRPEMPIVQEEIFGPVLAVITFNDEEEAVALANNSVFGLASGVWTQNVHRAHRMVQALESGIVWVNTYRAASYAAPWGGYKQSGYGRESSAEAIAEYTQVKSVWIELTGQMGDPFAVR
jgi:acyl-CoA reductase-like NAD-dependent aldehyde dehydrogenase